VLLQARYMERDLTELRAAAGAGAGWAAAAAGDVMQDMFVQVGRGGSCVVASLLDRCALPDGTQALPLAG
jgi:hypothetical protein